MTRNNNQRKTLFTDGEGPLTPKDLAKDIFKRITFFYDGKEIPGEVYYSVLSFYDDYLAEKGTEGYQAGDTLALIIPHLLAHGITDEDVMEEARTATLCPGIEEHFSRLKNDKWNIRIISTAYSPMWKLIGDRLGIPMEHITCTRLDLSSLRQHFRNETFNNTVKFAEQKVLSMLSLADQAMEQVDKGKPIVQVLEEDKKFKPLLKAFDGLYWEMLPEMGYETLNEVKVMGGRRKVEAAREFADKLGIPLSKVAYVGDSITDSAFARELKREGGLPIAQNGNSYILRDSVVGVATTDMRKTRIVLDKWALGGLLEVQKFVVQTKGIPLRSKEGQPVSENIWGACYDLLNPNNEIEFAKVLSSHKECRSAIRGLSTARLG